MTKLTDKQIDGISGDALRKACREANLQVAGKQDPDMRRMLKKANATAAGKSTPADPKAAQKAGTNVAKNQAPVSKAQGTAAVAAKPTAKAPTERAIVVPDLKALFAEMKVNYVAMGQSMKVLENAINNGAQFEAAAPEVEEAPAAEEGNIEPTAEVEGEQEVSLSQEWIDSADDDNLKAVLVQAGYGEADLEGADHDTLHATLSAWFSDQAGEAAAVEAEPTPEPDIAMREALFGGPLPSNIDGDNLSEGLECLVIAPEDSSFYGADGQPMIHTVTVKAVTEDGLIQVLVPAKDENGADVLDIADVPLTHLYVVPPPPPPKPVLKKPVLALKK